MKKVNNLSPQGDGASALADRLPDLWGEPGDRKQSLIDPAGVWLFLRRNLKRISLTSLGAAGIALGASFLFPLKYSATAVLVVDPRPAKVTRVGGVIANIGGDAIAIESIVQVSRSDGFLGELVDELGLARNPSFGGQTDNPEKARLAAIDRLAGRLSIARRGTTYVIDVIATTPSAETSARIANAAAAKILSDQTALRSGTDAETAREIERRLSTLRGRVGRAEEAAAHLKARLNVTDAGSGATLLQRRIVELNQQLVLATARKAEARAHFELLRKAGSITTDSLPQSIQSSMLSALTAELARLSRQAADQATVLGPRHPEATSLKAQITDVKRQIAAEIRRMTAAAQNDFLEAEQREADLSRELKTAQTESGELGPQMVKLDELEREAKAERAIYEELLNRERELLQVKDLEPSDIRIVSRAARPTRPTPSRTILVAGSIILGLLVGLSYAVSREWIRRTMKTSVQAEQLGAIDALGFLPRIGAMADGTSGSSEVPDLTSWLSDIWSDIAPPQDAGGRVILISSTLRGEGRSTVAINLAAHLSRSGASVLLIEADRAEHIKNPPYGFLDVLRTSENLGSAIVQQRSDGYMLLPYGGRTVKSQNDVRSLMSGMTLRAVLKLARKWFDVIVIDGPPALETKHARALALQADTTLFVIEWDKTEVAAAEKALHSLEPKQTGILFNKADVERLRLYDPERSRQIESQALAT